MGITVLGPLTVDGSGRLSPRDRVVLQALATRAGHPVSVDELIDALWGDQPPASAAKILQGCIVRLRKELGPEAIDTAPQGYVLTLPPGQVDAVRFERVVVRARELLTLGRGGPRRLPADRGARALARGRVRRAAGLAAGRSPRPPPGRAAARGRGAARRRAPAQRAASRGARRGAVDGAQRPAARASLDAARAGAVPGRPPGRGAPDDPPAQVGAARPSSASTPAPTCRPRAGDPAAGRLAAVRAPVGASASTCPWQGLMAYDVDDAERFFGRDDDVDACLDIVRRTSFLALVGPSGSGKSSILRAGVAAALQGAGPPVITVTPGRHPLAVPDRARPGARDGGPVRRPGRGGLLALRGPRRAPRVPGRVWSTQAQPRPVLVAIRADRLADVAGHARFSRLVERGLYLVGALDERGPAPAPSKDRHGRRA